MARLLCPIVTIRVSAVSGDTDSECRAEMDSHADTCVVGKHALILSDCERPVNVTGYDSEGTVAEGLRTVNAAIAYDDPTTGETKIIIVNQAIEIPHLVNHLLCPMQLRMNDAKVDDLPKFLADNPTADNHTLILPNQDRGDDDSIRIPLSITGVTSYFDVRKPTEAEVHRCTKYEATYECPDWDPHSKTFSEQEAAMTGCDGELWPEAVLGSRGRKHNISGLATDYDPEPSQHDQFATALSSNVRVCQVKSKPRQKIDPEKLAARWGIGVDVATRTIERTTQRGVRTQVGNLWRRFPTNDRMLRYRRLGCDLYADTLISKTKSRRGNKYAEVFAATNTWCKAYPCETKSDVHHGLSNLFANEGVPNNMIIDGSLEQTKGQFKSKCRAAGCHVKQIEKFSPFSNLAEQGIRELKRGVGRDMVRSRSPKAFWDDCLELKAAVRCHTARQHPELHGEVPETMMKGETADISPICEHGWWEWVYYRNVAASFPEDKECLGRYLGPSPDIGPAMTAKILKANGQVTHCSTYRAITFDEEWSPIEQEARKVFDKAIHKKFGPGCTPEDYMIDDEFETPSYEPYEDEVDGSSTPNLEADDVTPEDLDNYVGARIMLPRAGEQAPGRVTSRKRDRDGNLSGTSNANPILDSRTYNVEFEDGDVTEFTANVIAENMYAQCDEEGNQYVLFDEIVDYRKDDTAVTPMDQILVVNGRSSMRKTTIGWKLCVRWKDGSTSWERLADLKESHPVKVAEYAYMQGIDHEPAFNWWVGHVLKKRDRIIAKVKSREARYLKRNCKYGIAMPDNVEDAKRLDDENGNTLWQDSIAKEMEAVRVAFKLLNGGEEPPPGYQQIRCHMIFTVKIEDFRRKARHVAGGHTTEAPATITYASVVSRETVRIALTLAALNDLEVKASDIQNAYLTAPCAEKIWTILGPEFGADAGKKALIVRALYGLKSAGASFRNHLADCMRLMGYTSCMADQDLWMKPMVRPSDGHKYYAYILLYVDDCLCIHHDAMGQLVHLDKFFKMKPGSMGDPEFYLGAKVKKMDLANGVQAWALSASKYVQDAVRNVEAYMQDELGGRKLQSKKARAPFPHDFVPELDTSPTLGDKLSSYYQSLIGILRWMVELGRVDIITEVSLLASQLAMPREAHLDAAFHIFAYLKNKHNARLPLDPTYPVIDMSVFKDCDWKHFYGEATEAIPPNAPDARGKEVDLRLFVDSDHAGDKRTRRSRTGYFIYLNMAPIAWFSKKQGTIETSVFGAEFVAMKVGMEALRGLRYKLRMMGVPLSGPSYIYGDNMSVIHNTQRPESTLNKKSNSICYHAIREAVAMGECLTGHISTHENVADLGTKVIGGGAKRDHLVSKVLYDIAD